MNTRFVAVVMFVVSLIFWVATVKDYKRAGGRWTIAGKTYRRIATIFTVVGIGLYLLHAFCLNI